MVQAFLSGDVATALDIVLRDDPPAARCGDGVIDRATGEVCDDGNTADDDDCAGDCRSVRCTGGSRQHVDPGTHACYWRDPTIVSRDVAVARCATTSSTACRSLRRRCTRPGAARCCRAGCWPPSPWRSPAGPVCRRSIAAPCCSHCCCWGVALWCGSTGSPAAASASWAGRSAWGCGCCCSRTRPGGSTWAEVENAMRSLRHHPTADGGHEGEGEDAGDGTALSCCLQGAAQGPQDGGAGLLRRRAPGTSASTIAPADRQA